MNTVTPVKQNPLSINHSKINILILQCFEDLLSHVKQMK